jgi:thiol-disulfide isomerase/thioredoxin
MWCALAALAGTACEDRKQGEGGDPPSRVNGAKTSARQGATAEAFCDAHYLPGKGPAFQWPAMAAGSPAPIAPSVPTSAAAAGGNSPPAAATGWRWINVWATWCKPCIEEMPRLRGWRAKLAAAGKPFELAFVSVDETDAEVAEFRQHHPDTPPSLRLADPTKSPAWFRELGLSGNQRIPIHLFVDPTNHLRCAREGEVREQDYAVVEKLLGS